MTPDLRALVVFADSSLHRSRISRRIADALAGLPGVQVQDLYQLYPDFYIDVRRERELLKELDSIRTWCGRKCRMITMKCRMMTMETTLGIGHAAKLLGITVKTLQRWELEGRLVPVARIAIARRRNTESQRREALESKHAAGAPDQD